MPQLQVCVPTEMFEYDSEEDCQPLLPIKPKAMIVELKPDQIVSPVATKEGNKMYEYGDTSPVIPLKEAPATMQFDPKWKEVMQSMLNFLVVSARGCTEDRLKPGMPTIVEEAAQEVAEMLYHEEVRNPCDFPFLGLGVEPEKLNTYLSSRFCSLSEAALGVLTVSTLAAGRGFQSWPGFMPQRSCPSRLHPWSRILS